MKNVELITIDKNAQLPHTVAQRLNKQLHVAHVKQFADGEIYVGLDNPGLWKNKKAVIIQSTDSPVNKHILEVSFLAHELKNAGAQSVVTVIPYFGYARQEKSDIKGKPGPAQVIAHLYQGSGIDYMMMVELHNPLVQTFFVIPSYNITVNALIAQHIKDTFGANESICLIAPDEGAQERVADIAQQIGCGFTVFEKERYDIDKTRIIGQTESCQAASAIIIDDIIDTGGTAIQAADQLLQQGFTNVYGYFVHGVFSKNALERIDKSAFTKVFVSNTIEQVSSLPKKVEVFDVSNQVANVIKEYV